jgi:hypothetical protein
MIPVRLDDCEIPGRLKQWQSVDLYKPAGYERLAQAVLPEQPKSKFSISGPDHRLRTLTWFRVGLERCRAVASIETAYNILVGSAFLVAGPDLHPDLPPLVVVTAGHAVPETLDPAEVLVAFHGLDDDPSLQTHFRVARLCWYQPSNARGLDTTILELAAYPQDVIPTPLATALPPKPLHGSRAYIIGHPYGTAQPQYSLHDTMLLDYDRSFLHYRSPTHPGSAGSPVFNDEWQLIGLHHAAGYHISRLNGAHGTYAAGEGITIDAIRRGLANKLSDTGSP